MLQLLHGHLPDPVRLECEQLVRNCEPSVLARTVRRVEEWAEMLGR